MDFLLHYGDLYLGKTTVLCKDTPAFIANRVGVFSIMSIFGLMDKLKLTIDQVEAKLDRVTPAPYRVTAHHLLILHGRYVCKARKPECWRCVVADLCAFKPKTPPPTEAGKP